MATIQDMANTAAFIREGFLALATEVGSNSHPMKIMDASVNLYLNICRLEAALQDAATPSSENTPGGAAEKMPGGGSGNFDREGGLENPKAPDTPAPHVSNVKVTGKLGETLDYKIDYDDHQFFVAVTVPVKVFFSAFREGVYLDPAQSVAVATSVDLNGDLFCSGKLFREDKGDVVWGILEQAEKVEELPEFRKAYGLWQQRAEAYNRAEELYTKAA